MKQMILVTGLVLVVVCVVLVIYFHVPVTNHMDMEINYQLYDHESHMYEIADLVVIGHVETSLKDDLALFESLPGQDHWSFCSTLSPFYVDRVLRGSLDGDTLNLLQPAAIGKRPDGRPVKHLVEKYQELKKDDVYILYLQKAASSYRERFGEDTYMPLSVYLGVVNLSEPQTDERMIKLREEAIARFSVEIEEVIES